uniref:Epoxyqueuosine reductase QueH n=1 Tax=Desulfobacca acetoxidans TaxID=60893 RepID=A0A7V4G9P3_9BACT
MKILLHICCGPCAVYPVEVLRQAGHEVEGFFYNPNIHPYQEFRRRMDTLEEYAGMVDLPVRWDQSYDLEEFLRQVVYREEQRCGLCYRMRLQRAARAAREGGFEAFTSTLLYSRHQQHELICRTAAAAGAEMGITFHYEDFRRGWQEGVAKSKELGLYRQPYCGCIFSERDRYARPAGRRNKARPES